MKDLSWELNRDQHVIEITHQGKIVMTIGMCEAIESCTRQKVIQHVKVCDNTPWLKRWQAEKHQGLVDILKE